MQKLLREYKHLTFSQCIEKLERELQTDYIGGCYAWIDETQDGAWSKAINRFEKAILAYRDHLITDDTFTTEQEIYFSTVHNFVQEYRKHKQLDASDSYLKSLAN